ncbi:MAG: hypothetical protein ACI4BH_02115 [Muribaculaceae bacterium]
MVQHRIESPIGNRHNRTSFLSSSASNLQNTIQLQQSSLKSLFDKTYTRLNRVEWKNIHKMQAVQEDPLMLAKFRSGAVRRAWKWERFRVKLGGGSNNWSRFQRSVILENGNVPGYEGHHAWSVKSDPDLAGYSDNILLMSHKQHYDVHSGNYKNSTHLDWENRTIGAIKDFKRAQRRKEIIGLGAAAGIGFITNVALTLVNEFTINGWSLQTLKCASIPALKEGGQGAAIGTGYYASYRLGGMALEAIVENSPSLTPKLANFVKSSSGKIAIIGGVILFADSLYDFVKETNNGSPISKALIHTANKQALPICLLALTYVSPPAGIIASAGAILFDGYVAFANSKLQQKIEIHAISCHYDKAMRYIK